MFYWFFIVSTSNFNIVIRLKRWPEQGKGGRWRVAEWARQNITIPKRSRGRARCIHMRGKEKEITMPMQDRERASSAFIWVGRKGKNNDTNWNRECARGREEREEREKKIIGMPMERRGCMRERNESGKIMSWRDKMREEKRDGEERRGRKMRK